MCTQNGHLILQYQAQVHIQTLQRLARCTSVGIDPTGVRKYPEQ